MNYIHLGCFLLLLVNLSETTDFQVEQKPRFYGVKVGKNVGFICFASNLTLPKATITWYKIKEYNEDSVKNKKNMRELNADLRISMYSGNVKGQLLINNVEITDSGIYYCKIDKRWGPGAELQVNRYSKRKVEEQRNSMKDIIIFIQGFLLVLCIIIPLVWYYRLEQKEEAVYEEPEHDHTYEGLDIEHCGDLYEDLTAFAQTPDAEASWEIESPEQE